MYRCPNEILLYIFELACDDGGSTGRVLSLVSRRFHHLAKDTMYRSVAIVGLKRIKTFVTILEGLPEHKRRVRHLFLSSISQDTGDGLARLPDGLHKYVCGRHSDNSLDLTNLNRERYATRPPGCWS